MIQTGWAFFFFNLGMLFSMAVMILVRDILRRMDLKDQTKKEVNHAETKHK